MQSQHINDSTHSYDWVVNYVAVSCGLPTAEARRVLRSVIEIMTGGLQAGDVIYIRGFVKFWVVGSGQGRVLRSKLLSSALRRLGG